MNAEPQALEECWLHRDLVRGMTWLTIGIRDAKFNLKEVRYEVRRGVSPGEVLLVKGDEVYTVKPGGSCDCPDNKYRRRPTACKHCLGINLAKAWLARLREQKNTEVDHEKAG